MNWKIEFDTKARDEFLRLDTSVKKRIIKFIDTRLLKSANPRKFGSPLKGHLSELWKYRVGDCRLVCKIEDNFLTILLVSIGHRSEIYKS